MLLDSIKSFFRRRIKKSELKEEEIIIVPFEPEVEPEAEPTPESEPEKEIIYGTYGRLEIPDLNIGVPLNGVESGSAQQVNVCLLQNADRPYPNR